MVQTRPFPLVNLLRARRDELILRWTSRVIRDPDVPQARRVETPRLIDHIPEILECLVDALESKSGATAEQCARSAGASAPARQHASLRLTDGYTLAEALRELSHLRCAIIELCAANGRPLDPAEALIVHATIDETMWTGAMEMERISRRAIEEELAFRDHFMAILGHDLRNPLTSISFAAATLSQGDGHSTSQGIALRRITAAADRIAHMLDELIDLSRSRFGGGIAIEPRPTDVSIVCAAVVEELQGTSQGISIVLETEGNLEGLWDPQRLMQLVSNLVGNAIEYCSPDHPVTVSARDEGSTVVLRVHNQGTPIPADKIPVIFEPFRQGDQEGRARRGKGLGLGLYIARQIALAHGGSIEVTSDPGDGTTFTVRLPRAGR